MIRVAVVGAGYWGPNLIRNFTTCPATDLVAVCDLDQARLDKVLSPYPSVEGTTGFDALIARDDIDAIAIATPVDTHAPLGVAALEAGKHVLIEKPLASSIEDAEKLVATAKANDRILMVDHIFVYSEPVRKMKEVIDGGEMGDIYFIDSIRINLGLIQRDINVVWDLAPHDLSIMDYLVDRDPKRISVFGTCHAHSDAGIEDVAYINVDLGDNLLASFHVNWLSPVKVRHFIVGGSKKSIVYNDLDPAEKIKVYDCGVTVKQDVESRRNVLFDYRTGDVWSPHIRPAEALQTMVSHFADCVKNKKTPITDGESGLRVVKLLATAQTSIKAQGAWITL